MRPWLIWFCCLSIVWLCACSNRDSKAEDDAAALTPNGTGGASSVRTDGSGGSDGPAFGTTDGSGGLAQDGEGTADQPGISGQAGSSTTAGGPGSMDGGGSTGTPPPASDVTCPVGPFANDPLLGGIAPQPDALCGGMTFTEGPVWFAERNTLFFSDFQLNNPAIGRIMSFTLGQCQPFIGTAGTNGLVIAPDGNLLGARHSDQTLTIFDLETQQPSVLVADNAGVSFNSPNDIAVRSDGNLYFTDPTFLLGNRPSEQPAATYRRDPRGGLSIIDTGTNPNGIALSPDESRLYVARLGGASNVVAFDIDADGAVSNPQVLIDVGSDGMAVDCAGNLYLTQNGVQIFSSSGEPIGTIDAPGAANVAFGGPERRTLYITARSNLLAVELAIPGLPY